MRKPCEETTLQRMGKGEEEQGLGPAAFWRPEGGPAWLWSECTRRARAVRDGEGRERELRVRESEELHDSLLSSVHPLAAPRKGDLGWSQRRRSNRRRPLIIGLRPGECDPGATVSLSLSLSLGLVPCRFPFSFSTADAARTHGDTIGEDGTVTQGEHWEKGDGGRPSAWPAGPGR